jgi:ABC-type Zn uptake system ZnuABC Zn-binding protein ZnuA
MRTFPVLLLAAAALPAQQPFAVCTTTPDLEALVAELLPDADVQSFAAGPEDAHFLEARPSMVRTLHDADALVEIGLDFEVGWLPVLVDGARNASVLRGARSRIDASAAVARLGIPSGPVDRSMGDVHAGGNPHYLLDPLRGLQVAALLVERFAALRPDLRGALDAGHARLRERLAAAMVGPELAKLYEHDAERLALLFEHGKLEAFLREHGDLERLGGWFALLLPHRGALAVADHDLWPYFAQRFCIEIVGFLEPRPGVGPTSRHLERIVQTMRERKVRVVLSAPYFAARHAELVARATGARIAQLAHQVGARACCNDYVGTVDHNVRALAAALAGDQ